MLLLVFAGAAHAGTWQWIDGQRVMNYVTEGSGLWLIDVRNAAAYEAGHIEGAVSIPQDMLMHKKFPAQKMLVLVDDSLGQQTARQAADALVEKGQERVFVLEGGLAAWRIEGLPTVWTKEREHGVTADELKWALGHSVPMKIYDLRDTTAQQQGTVQNSESVIGKTLDERVEDLRRILSSGSKKDLAEKLKKSQPIVLIFAAADHAEEHTRKLLQGAQGDVRYLIGGYEATISEKLRKQQTTGSCPTCPGSVK